MPVYEFECAEGHITEDLVPMGTKNTRCTKCKHRLTFIASQFRKKIFSISNKMHFCPYCGIDFDTRIRNKQKGRKGRS